MSTSIENMPIHGRPANDRWLPLIDRAITLRATVVAIIVGGILTAVNQSGWIAGNEPPQVLQLFLVFLLPFAVVLVSQIAGVRQARIESNDNGTITNRENFVKTVFSHGIPTRAVVIGLFFGSTNAALTLANAFLNSGSLEAVSVVPLAQAYALPFVFGLLSQAISYKRARKSHS